eukprot:symbB.v1.2.016812.t1/scaffold1292.1/size223628/10
MAPKQLSFSIFNLARLQVSEGPIFQEVVPEIVRDIVGYTHRDVCLCLWAMAKTSQKDIRLAARVQHLYREGNSSRTWNSSDVSMLLWSLSRLQWHAHPEFMGRLTQHAVLESHQYSDSALLVTCLSLARMNFTQPPVPLRVFPWLSWRGKLDIGVCLDYKVILAFVVAFPLLQLENMILFHRK